SRQVTSDGSWLIRSLTTIGGCDPGTTWVTIVDGIDQSGSCPSSRPSTRILKATSPMPSTWKRWGYVGIVTLHPQCPFLLAQGAQHLRHDLALEHVVDLVPVGAVDGDVEGDVTAPAGTTAACCAQAGDVRGHLGAVRQGHELRPVFADPHRPPVGGVGDYLVKLVPPDGAAVGKCRALSARAVDGGDVRGRGAAIERGQLRGHTAEHRAGVVDCVDRYGRSVPVEIAEVAAN